MGSGVYRRAQEVAEARRRAWEPYDLPSVTDYMEGIIRAWREKGFEPSVESMIRAKVAEGCKGTPEYLREKRAGLLNRPWFAALTVKGVLMRAVQRKFGEEACLVLGTLTYLPGLHSSGIAETWCTQFYGYPYELQPVAEVKAWLGAYLFARERMDIEDAEKRLLRSGGNPQLRDFFTEQ